MTGMPLTDWERSQLGRAVFADNRLDIFKEPVCRFVFSVTPRQMLMQLQDQRGVDSYASFRYAPGWYAENPGSDWYDADWARRRQWDVAQAAEFSSPQNTYGNDYPPANVYPGARDHSIALANRTALDHQSQRQHTVIPNFPARRTARGPQATQATTAPATRLTAPSNIPRVPAALPSNITQPTQRRASDHDVDPPSLPPNLRIPLAQRPPPPAGFSDQPPARMYAVDYATPNEEGRPRRHIQWPLGIEISIVEICTFCPSWFQTPEVINRAIRNGWSREALAKVQVRAEGLTTYEEFKRRFGRIQKQISKAGKLIGGPTNRFNSRRFRDGHGPQDDLTADNWLFSCSYDDNRSPEWLGDMPLSALYNNVVSWPTGNDRLLMTQCLEFARQNPERQLDTSHWAWIISSQNLTVPSALPNGQHRDVEALDRVNLIASPMPPPPPPPSSVVAKKQKKKLPH
jgi:hypothetical protein